MKQEGSEQLNMFKRNGGRLPLRDLVKYIDQVPYLQVYEREYVKTVVAKFENPHEPLSTRYVTQEEFLQGLDEMAENNRDLISPEEVERIKSYFEKAY